jgi:hypothetical protein
MADPPLQYAGAPEDTAPLPRRTIGTWLKLLAVWSVGLCFWAFYIAMLIYLFVKIVA